MKNLIDSIAQQSGLTVECAATALQTVSQFVKEQYPLFSNTIDTILGTSEISKK